MDTRPDEDRRTPDGDAYLYPGNSFRVSLVATAAGMLASLLLVGLFSPYWNRAGSDMVSAYEGLLFNSRLPPEFLVYPGVLSSQLVGLWYWVLHAIGLAPVHTLAALPQGASEAVFDATWQRLIVLGRAYSFVLATTYVLGFMVLVRRLVGRWQVAALAGIALAFSSGVALEFRIIRSELPSSALIAVALCATLLAADQRTSTARLWWLGLAGLCVPLGLVEKVQGLMPALAIPVIALAFPPRASLGALGDRGSQSNIRLAILAALALLVCLPAAGLLTWGAASFAMSSPVRYVQLGAHLSGIYQLLIVGYVVVAMLAYAWIWKVALPDTLASVLAVAIGLGTGFLALYLRYDTQATIAVANPIEHLQAYAGGASAGLDTGSALGSLLKLLGGLGKAIAAHTLVLYPNHRPTLMIEWLAIAAGTVLWRRGQTLAAVQIGLLIAAAIGVDAIFTLRSYKVYYLPYTDPFLILAGALAGAAFWTVLRQVRVQHITAAVLVFYVVWGHAQPARAAYGNRDKLAKVCGVVPYFTSRLKIPYCAGDIVPLSALKQVPDTEIEQ